MKKTVLKILAPVLVLTLLSSSFAFAATDGAPAVPSDVKGTVSEKAVAALMEAGAVSGDTDGLFHPEANLTRAQVCKMLVTLIDPPKAVLTGTPTQQAVSSSFTDLAGAQWAKAYIDYSAANGIAKGYSDKTFRPSGNVTMAELTTFAVRACGYTDKDLSGTWPENYLKKAEELDLFADMGMVTETGATPADTPESMQKMPATKEWAAMMLFNAMDKIVKYEEPTSAEWSLKDAVAGLDKAGLKFVKSGSFDANITTFNDIALAKDVKVLAYGKRTDYTADMTFSKKVGDYDVESVYKMKLVTTNAFYKQENGEITLIVLPKNVGFSGKVYCVINDTDGTTKNVSGEAVGMYNTLTAMKEMTWIADKDLDPSALNKETYLDGQVYELYTKHGVVQSIALVSDSQKKSTAFTELTQGWQSITDTNLSRNLVQIADANGNDQGWIEINASAAVYTIEKDGKAYDVGSLSNVKKNAEVRLYDISDDKTEAADIIVVRIK